MMKPVKIPAHTATAITEPGIGEEDWHAVTRTGYGRENRRQTERRSASSQFEERTLPFTCHEIHEASSAVRPADRLRVLVLQNVS